MVDTGNELFVVDTLTEEEILLKYFKDSCATVIQKYFRRYFQRLKIIDYIETKYEKIYDPRRKLYYYYNIEEDRSSWRKPVLLLKGDLSRIAPTYTLDEASVMIQRHARRRRALKRVRRLYKITVSTSIDEKIDRLHTYCTDNKK